MQTLVEVLVELKRLGASDAPDRLDRIAQLFANPRAPAELQVGRHAIARQLAGEVDAQLDSLDPKRRMAAIVTARTVFPRSAAARVLRRVYHDPDRGVRGVARRAVARLGLIPASPRGVKSTGSWAFGIFPTGTSVRTVRTPTRPSALASHGLPALATPADVARLVGVDEDQLTRWMRPGTDAGAGYIEFEIAKAKGGTRRIAAPRTPLRKAQRILLDRILAPVPLHDACHGFVAGRSTVTNAAPHQGAALVLKLDLKDFFPTLHFRRVQGLFEQLGYNAAVAATLAGLTTYRPKLAGVVAWPGRLPQGAPTSPALANLACRRLDRRLSSLAARCGAVYTRYADDLTFSFARVPELRIGRFLWWVDGICYREGFLERPDKRRILRAKHQQRITGLVVNAGVHVPRADRKRFRAILHNCRRHGLASQAHGRDDFPAYLAGYAAYVRMVEPALGQRFSDEVDALLGGSHG